MEDSSGGYEKKNFTNLFPSFSCFCIDLPSNHQDIICRKSFPILGHQNRSSAASGSHGALSAGPRRTTTIALIIIIIHADKRQMEGKWRRLSCVWCADFVCAITRRVKESDDGNDSSAFVPMFQLNATKWKREKVIFSDSHVLLLYMH